MSDETREQAALWVEGRGGGMGKLRADGFDSKGKKIAACLPACLTCLCSPIERLPRRESSIRKRTGLEWRDSTSLKANEARSYFHGSPFLPPSSVCPTNGILSEKKKKEINLEIY